MNDEQILKQAAHIATVREAEANVERARQALEQAENTLKEVKRHREESTVDNSVAGVRRKVGGDKIES